MKTCKDVMTPGSISCLLPSDTIERAAQIMRDEDVSIVPVVDDLDREQLLGIITERDIVIYAVANGTDLQGITVAHVMSSELKACKENGDVSEALEFMEENQVSHLPVVDMHNKLIGVVSRRDAAVTSLRAQMKGWEGIKEISKSHH